MNYAEKKAISFSLKQRFGKDNNIANFEEHCVFCFAGANQIKKAIGCMVDAMGLAVIPKASLVLALKSSNCQIGGYTFVGEHDMSDLLHHPNIFLIQGLLNDESHRDIFLMSDFLLYPSQGEAPGLQISESQLCGVIPICTNYTGMPEESCAPEFLIDDFTLLRGQFNAYRAIVGAPALKEKIVMAFDLWNDLQSRDPLALECYEAFQAKVEEKFRDRTWANTALELDSIFQSLLNGGLRVETEVTRL